MSIGWIGVDLDGTLAKHDQGTWGGPTHIGEPIPLMVERVKAWLAAGEDVRIFTARVGPGQSPDDATFAGLAIRNWCAKHIGRRLPVTASKDYHMRVLYDDRAIQVELNTGRIVTDCRA